MSTTPNIGLDELAAAQSQPEVLINRSERRLDALVQLTVKDKDLTAPPGSPADGDAYIIAGTGTGGWAGHSGGALAYYSSGWLFVTPHFGWLAYVQDEAVHYRFEDGSPDAWVILATGGATNANVAFSGVLTPSQITSNQNDYNPTSLSTACVLRLNTDASRNVTGIQGGAAGRIFIVHNVGANNIVFKNADTGSSAANRFAMNADLTLTAGEVALFQYDSTDSRWRKLGRWGGLGDLGFYFPGGPPTSSQLMFKYVTPRALVIPGNASGSVGHIGTNPTATFTMVLSVAGASVGTIAVSTGGVFTFATTSGNPVNVTAGQRIEIAAPSGTDATAADIALSLSVTF